MCGRDPDRRVEQDELPDALRRGRRCLVGDAPAEGMAEPGAALLGRGLEHVGDVLLEVPRRLPRGTAVPAQVEGDHVEPVGQALGKLGEVAAVARDPVQADERRQPGLAPLIPRQAHSRVAASGAEASSVRRALSRCTRDQTTVPSLSIRKVPRTGAPRSSLKTS